MFPKCSACQKKKSHKDFYRNHRKRNGIESHCKVCVLEKKKGRYTTTKKLKQRATKYRGNKNIRVLNILSCTLHETHIKESSKVSQIELEEIVKDLVCQLVEEKK